MLYTGLAKRSIHGFSLNELEYESHYKIDFKLSGIEVKGNGSLFVREGQVGAKIKVNFGNTKGNRVFLGRNVKGDFSVFFKGNNSTVYIGNGCNLSDVQIRSFQSEDFIAVGNQVTTTSKNVWISGNGAGKAKPAIIIGDDCMFSYDIVIRNTDAHPIFDLSTDEQINQPVDIVHIEPHVWIGEQVSILKSVTVGACSIISLGSIVTKDIPRFSIACGIPAVSKKKVDIYWARGDNEQSRNKAKSFIKKYKEIELKS